MKAIINGKVILKEAIAEDKVIIFDKYIESIINYDEFKKQAFDKLEIIDIKGKYISPGFIDIHIHGSNGSDVMDGTDEALENISKTLLKNGVTSFLPTTMTMSQEKIYTALNCIKKNKNKNLGGAKILGAHLEGPFINKIYKGAQKEDNIIEPDFDFIKEYLDVIKIITLAPEMDKSHKFIKRVKDNTKIILSMGHSNATYEEAMEGILNGISHVTHLFNAMTPLNHRKPGLVGAAFNSDVFCELIADTIHVHPGMYKILIKQKPKDKIILITDSMRAGCLKDGVSELGGQKVIVKDKSARLEDGTLAGSILRLNEGVKNFKSHGDLKLFEAINMASLNPAKELSLDDEIGSIEVGKKADLTVFDENLKIEKTFVDGTLLYEVDKEKLNSF